ncbi:MAG: insulinase family protein [Thermodesulfovibrio sp.]|nr:insulinase family protein [Thermodesulfovibrio sp.]
MSKKVILSSGIPLIIHKMNNFHSFVLGIWIKHGSRHEPEDKNGLSHFIEHLFFQGTKKRTAKEISLEIDSIGGDLNAFTAREFTALYVKGLQENLSKSVELIADIFSNPVFPKKEIEKERSIIMDEIRMVNDNPEELVHDLFMEKSFNNSLGLPILGKEHTVKTISREDIIHCFKNYYGTNNCIISCAGNFEINKLMDELEKNITKRESSFVPTKKNVDFSPGINIFQKDLSEIHLCLGFQIVPFKHKDRYAITLLNCIIGGSVSSKLFQEIREKKGLAYNIYSFVSYYSDTGVFGIYTACEPSKVNKIIKLINSILKSLPNKLKEDEMDRAKTQIISQILYSTESPSSIMQNLAYHDIYLGGVYRVREQISQINAVNLNEIKRVADYIVKNKFSLTILGSIDRNNLDI